jgi:hypothetical protein
MHHTGGGASSSASPLVGALPSDPALRSCFGRYGVTASQTWAWSLSHGFCACAWRLVPNSPGVRLPSGWGFDAPQVRTFVGDLGSALESADKSESMLSWARLAWLPLNFLLATAPSLLSSCSQSLLSELKSDRVALESCARHSSSQHLAFLRRRIHSGGNDEMSSIKSLIRS